MKTSERSNTVLFAGLADGERLVGAAGDAAALNALHQCFTHMREAAETLGGRVIKTVGQELMALFPNPDAAAAAAAQMQHAIDRLPEVGGLRLGVRIGFHAGPVLQSGGDVFGDTVNLAARLAEQANPEQIITSTETAAALAEHHQRSLRQLYPIEVKGKAEEVFLCELVWRVGNDTAQFDGLLRPVPRRAPPVVLRLRYREQEFLRRRENDSLTVGREDDCDLVIRHPLVSRHHCLIQRRLDKFVLVDRSSNGTFVTIEGDTEFALHREELILRKHGWIALGQPRAESEHLLEFFSE